MQKHNFTPTVAARPIDPENDPDAVTLDVFMGCQSPCKSLLKRNINELTFYPCEDEEYSFFGVECCKECKRTMFETLTPGFVAALEAEGFVLPAPLPLRQILKIITDCFVGGTVQIAFTQDTSRQTSRYGANALEAKAA